MAGAPGGGGAPRRPKAVWHARRHRHVAARHRLPGADPGVSGAVRQRPMRYKAWRQAARRTLHTQHTAAPSRPSSWLGPAGPATQWAAQQPSCRNVWWARTPPSLVPDQGRHPPARRICLCPVQGDDWRGAHLRRVRGPGRSVGPGGAAAGGRRAGTALPGRLHRQQLVRLLCSPQHVPDATKRGMPQPQGRMHCMLQLGRLTGNGRKPSVHSIAAALPPAAGTAPSRSRWRQAPPSPGCCRREPSPG